MTLTTPHIEAFAGRVLTPHDPDYDNSRRVWHGAVDRHPALIAEATSAQDVAAAVRHARDHDLEIAVRCGGHSLSGHSVVDDGIVIDLRELRRVDVDLTTRRVRAGAGLRWGELDAATQAHGLAVTGGRVSDTGVAGLTLGSGSGWLERKLGLTSDNLLGATVVTAAGEIIHSSAHQHPDLFWGLHGGGGNFGVVTELEFQLHQVGPTVLGGVLLFEWSRAADTLRTYRDLMAGADEDLGGCAVLHLAPPAPFVPADLVGRPVLTLAVAAFGPLGRAEELVAPLRALGPVVDAVEPLPYTALQQMIDAGNPAGMRGQFDASFMDALPDDAIDAALEVAQRIPSGLSEVLLQPLGGEFARVSPETTALRHRDAGWAFHALSQWPGEDADEVNLAWSAQFVAAMAPYSRRAAHPNYVSDDRQERVRSFYGDDAYRRLVALKDRWDPENVFHRNMNIRPSS